MQRELCTFPLASNYLHKLSNAGYITVDDLKDVTPTELSEDLGIDKEESLKIVQTVRSTKDSSQSWNKKPTISGKHSSSSIPGSTNAFDLLQQEQFAGSIVTFCEKFDDMLGGGVPVGKITEFCGAPGIGKTQIGMQLAVDVQIPDEFGGLDGETIYIDTEGSFIVERVLDIATAAIRHITNVVQSSDADETERGLLNEALKKFHMESILSRIYVFRCHDYMQLIALSHVLPDFLEEHPKVKLIVLDSIAFHFRHDFDDLALRARLLNGLAQSFIKMACERQLAVVFMNQMTTRVKPTQLGQSHLIPALGESWGHASTIRVVLYWEDNQRFANLYKSPSRQEMIIPFQITADGVRDCFTNTLQQSHKDSKEAQSDQHSVPYEGEEIASSVAKKRRLNEVT
ncbi:DNA repair protein RAD51 homolog 3 [Pocillopora verrucosa]|uniref:DNA repair protein RAD51 homolog 3 n=1 Tax=Pocillopora verrucosa TaxID=203993 RepID=UPI00333F9DBD